DVFQHQPPQLCLDGCRRFSRAIAERECDVVVPFRQLDGEIEWPLARAEIAVQRIVAATVKSHDCAAWLKTKTRLRRINVRRQNLRMTRRNRPSAKIEPQRGAIRLGAAR